MCTSLADSRGKGNLRGRRRPLTGSLAVPPAGKTQRRRPPSRGLRCVLDCAGEGRADFAENGDGVRASPVYHEDAVWPSGRNSSSRRHRLKGLPARVDYASRSAARAGGSLLTCAAAPGEKARLDYEQKAARVLELCREQLGVEVASEPTAACDTQSLEIGRRRLPTRERALSLWRTGASSASNRLWSR